MEDRRSLASESLLVLVAAIWGFAFVAQRAGMDHVGPLTYNGVRFLIGFASLLPLIAFRRASALRLALAAASPRPAFPGPGAVRAVLIAGLVLFAGANLQQIGLQWTSAGKAGFITGLYVVLVPLVGIVLGRRAGLRVWIGALSAAIGLYILSVRSNFTMASGDLVVLASTAFWTAHILVVDRFAKTIDPLVLAAGQFLVCGLLTMSGALAFERIDAAATFRAALPILYGGLGSIGIAYTLQIVAQKRAHPARASIIMSLEAPFAALGGALLLGESLGARGLLGSGLMLTGMVVAQLPSTAAAKAAAKAPE